MEIESAASGSVPLTFGQKALLLIECLPLVFFLLALVFTLTLLDNITGRPPPVALPLFLGVVVLWMGYQAVQRLRDLMSGVAVAQEDVLERSWRSGGSGRRLFFGKFTTLGRIRLVPKAHFGSQNGKRYRVIYSPASKIVWALEEPVS